jgi:hypothetical protein
MDKIILLVRPFDLHILNENIEFSELQNTPIYSFNAEAAQFAFQNGLSQVKLIENIQSLGENPMDSHFLADRAARAFDFESGKLKKIYFNLDYNYNGWEYLNFYYFAYTKIRCEIIYEGLVKLLPNANEIIIAYTENDQDYYFDSKLVREALTRALCKKYENITGFKSSRFDYFKKEAFDNCFLIPEGSFKKIVNLPATFYDLANHQNRLKGINYLDFQSPYFDIKYGNSRALLSNAIDFKDEKYSLYKYNYLKLIESAIGFAEIETIRRQSIRFYKRSIFQLENLIKISSIPNIEEFDSIDVTDIDVGLQGPIFSIAEKYSIELTYWPHSKVTSSVLPVSHQLVVKKYSPMNNSYCLEQFGKIGYGDFKNIEIIVRDNSIIKNNNKILIIHNEIDDIAGIPLVRIDRFLIDYKRLIVLLKKLGLDVRSRQKPSHSYKSLIPNLVEELEGPINSILDWPDICISIGVPTTALINFWEKNTKCIHLTYYKLTEIDKGTLPDDVEVIDMLDTYWYEKLVKFLEKI